MKRVWKKITCESWISNYNTCTWSDFIRWTGSAEGGVGDRVVPAREHRGPGDGARRRRRAGDRGGPRRRQPHPRGWRRRLRRQRLHPTDRAQEAELGAQGLPARAGRLRRPHSRRGGRWGHRLSLSFPLSLNLSPSSNLPQKVYLFTFSFPFYF